MGMSVQDFRSGTVFHRQRPFSKGSFKLTALHAVSLGKFQVIKGGENHPKTAIGSHTAF